MSNDSTGSRTPSHGTARNAVADAILDLSHAVKENTRAIERTVAAVERCSRASEAAVVLVETDARQLRTDVEAMRGMLEGALEGRGTQGAGIGKAIRDFDKASPTSKRYLLGLVAMLLALVAASYFLIESLRAH